MVIHAPIYISHLCLPLVPCSHFACGRLCLLMILCDRWSFVVIYASIYITDFCSPFVTCGSLVISLVITYGQVSLPTLVVHRHDILIWSIQVICVKLRSSISIMSVHLWLLVLLYSFHLSSLVVVCLVTVICDHWSFAIFPAHMVNPCHFCSPLMITCGYL